MISPPFEISSENLSRKLAPASASTRASTPTRTLIPGSEGGLESCAGRDHPASNTKGRDQAIGHFGSETHAK